MLQAMHLCETIGKRNSSGGNAQTYSFSVLIYVATEVGGTPSVDWSRLIDDQSSIVNLIAFRDRS